MASDILPEPVLAGRKHELGELKSLLDLAIKGQGRTVFISGEAGAGKTRLLTELLNIAKKSDVTVLTGWCLSDAAVPYFPFVEAFDSYFSSNEEEEASAVNLRTSKKPSNLNKAKDSLTRRPRRGKTKLSELLLKNCYYCQRENP